MPTYIWTNKETESTVEIFASIKNMDIPPDDSGKWTRILASPMVLKASYLDGQRKDLTDLLVANKLKSKLANTRKGTQESKEISKELHERVKLK